MRGEEPGFEATFETGALGTTDALAVCCPLGMMLVPGAGKRLATEVTGGGTSAPTCAQTLASIVSTRVKRESGLP